jgi:predicted permease
MQRLTQDVRLALRSLRRHPGFTAVAVLTLALGIGGNTAIFSVVDAVLLRPLAYHQPDRLVTVLHATGRADAARPGLRDGSLPVAPANFLVWRAQARSFERLAAAQAWRATLTGTDRPEELKAVKVTADLLPLLGIAPALGRAFLPTEDRPGGGRPVVLSHGLWQRRFGGSRDVIGRTVRLNGEDHQVVGVMPPGFQFPPFWWTNAELVAPLDLTGKETDWDGSSLRVFGRLRPGITRSQAQAEMNTIWGPLARAHPAASGGLTVAVDSLQRKVVGGVRRGLLVLLAGVGFVLLIACANLANLLLARWSSRQQELAVRASLGATRGRLARQLLTESLVLALAGGLLGLALAALGLDLLLALAPADLPRLETVRLDGRVFAFTLTLSLVTGLLFGLAPAWRLSQLDLQGALKRGGRTTSGGGPGAGGLRGLLVVTEVALALVLLVGAGLMIRSFGRLRAVDAGFNPHHLLSLIVPLDTRRYPDARGRATLFRALIDRVAALPGVQSAGAINHLPLAGDVWGKEVDIVGAPRPPPGAGLNAVWRLIDPGYLATMQLDVTRGRGFTAQDGPGTPPVVIINEAFRRRVWPAEDPLGKLIRVSDGDGGPAARQVVGVVADARQQDWTTPPRPEVYLPYFQSPNARYLTLVVRASTPPGPPLITAIDRELRALDPELPLSQVTTLDRVVAGATGQPRFNLLLLNVFAAMAMILAALGIYGVMAYAVSRRTQELGIRLALGAQPAALRRLVVRQGMALAVAGLALGLGAALLAAPVMDGLLFQVSATDPSTFLTLPLLLAAVALLACWLPARHATRISPMTALRSD